MSLDETKSDCSSPRDAVFCIHRILPGKRKKGPPIILKDQEVVIGRHPEAQIVIPSENVSRKHAFLRKTTSSYDIMDAKSLNGVWVNEEQLVPLVPHELVSGDVFSLGNPEETVHMYLFSRHSSATASDNSLACRLARKEQLEKERQEREVEEEIQKLKRELEEKKESERRLQEQIQAQQKEYQETLEQEKERIQRERVEAESRLRQELEEKLEGEGRALEEQRTALLAERDRVEQELRQKLTQEMQESLLQQQSRLNKELEEKSQRARGLEEQLAQSKQLQTQSKSEMIHRFGDLLETELNCSICSELFAQAHTLGCSHTFCKHCITMWKKKKNECPICRTKIKSMVHALVLDNFIEQMVRNLSPDLKRNRIKLLKERGLSSLELEKELQRSPGMDPRVLSVSSSSSSAAVGSCPVQVSILSTPSASGAPTVAPTSVTLRQPNILLRPVSGASLPPGFQTLLQSVPGTGNTFRLVNMGAQSTLQRVNWAAPPPVTTFQPRQNVPPRPVRPASAHVHRGRGHLAPVFTAGRGAATAAGRARPRGVPPQPTRTDVVHRSSPSDIGEPEGLDPSRQSATEDDIVVPPVAHFVEVDGTIVPEGDLPPGSSTSTPSEINNNNNSDMTADASEQETVPSENAPITISSSADQSAIVISDSEENSSDNEDNSSDHDEDESEELSDYEPRYVRGAYYGGYGRCFSCGERGHWSNGCPY